MKLYFNNIIRLAICLVSIAFPLAPGLAAAQGTTQTRLLQVGVLPTLSARVLLNNYRPLQLYLERELKRPVEFTTAPDFKTFHLNTIAGKYDVVVTAAHLARLAQLEANYLPLASYKAANRGIIFEAKDQPLATIQDLKGKTLAFGDRNALIVSQTINYLQQQGLRGGQDYTLLDTQSHNSAAYSVQSHRSKLAITSPSGFKNIPETIKNDLKIFLVLPELPSLTWMANPRITSEAPKIKTALLNFTPDSEGGKQFFDATGYIGLREVSTTEMKALDPYALDISNRLRSSQ